MLIGIDASRANKKQRTGTEWYSFHLINHLLDLDPKNTYHLYTQGHLNEDFTYKNLHSNVVVKPLYWPPKRLWTQFRLSYEIRTHQPDVLFVPAHTLPICHPNNTITTCHDVGFERFPEVYSFKERAYHQFSMRYALKQARKIITVSNFSKKEILSFYKIKEDKIHVIPISYDESFYKPIENPEKIRKVLDQYKIKKPYIYYIGRLERKKNIARLVACFKQLKKNFHIEHHLVLVGSPGTGYSEIKKQIQGEFENSIIELGWVDQKDLVYLMNGADLFVFPSLYEGFGIPLLEAFACKTPVVASSHGSIPEIAGEAAYFFDPYNIQEMAETIEQTLKYSYLRNQMIEKGKQRISQYSWKKCAQQTLALLIS